MRKLLKSLIIAISVVLLFTGIAMARMYTVYVVVHGGLADPAWQLNYRGAQATAALFPDLKLRYVGPGAYNFEKFIAYLEAAIASNPDALVCTLTSPQAMDSILRPAIAAGLPVIAINAPDTRLPKERIPVLTYVGISSMYEAGALAARTVLEQVTPKRALYVNHHPGAFHIDEAGKGFIETMETAGVSAEQLVTGPDPVQGAELIIAYLKAHPETQVIAHPNVTHLETLVGRLRDEGYKPGEDILLGTVFDPSAMCLDFMEKGEIFFANEQQMYLQGVYGVLFAYMKAKYNFEPPLSPVGTGPIVITKENVPVLKELIEKGYR